MIIGLGGWAQAGKDTVADMMVADGGHKTYMSKPLENALLVLNPWVNIESSNWEKSFVHPLNGDFVAYSSLHRCVGYEGSKFNKDVRSLLQRLGTEVGRNILGEDVWVNQVFKEVKRLARDGRLVAITGIRYANELAALKRNNGVSIWVNRTGWTPLNDHSSEHSLSQGDFDYVIENDSDISSLARKVDDLLQTLRPKVNA